jgi:DNA-binding XRE family transcriptional regulator
MARKNLADARKASKFTQAQTAALASLTERQCRRIEAGTSGGSVRLWQQLSALFGKPIDCLLEQAPERGGGK